MKQVDLLEYLLDPYMLITNSYDDLFNFSVLLWHRMVKKLH